MVDDCLAGGPRSWVALSVGLDVEGTANQSRRR